MVYYWCQGERPVVVGKPKYKVNKEAHKNGTNPLTNPTPYAIIYLFQEGAERKNKVMDYELIWWCVMGVIALVAFVAVMRTPSDYIERENRSDRYVRKEN